VSFSAEAKIHKDYELNMNVNIRCLCTFIPFDQVAEKQTNLREEPYLVKKQIGSGS
jgi:hypothetical protein